MSTMSQAMVREAGVTPAGSAERAYNWDTHNRTFGPLTEDPYQALTFDMLQTAMREYFTLEDRGIIKNGKIAITEWPTEVHRDGRGYVYEDAKARIVGYRSIHEVQELIDFLSGDTLRYFGFTPDFIAKLHERIGAGTEEKI